MMSGASSSLALDLARRVTEAAKKSGRLIDDRDHIFRVALEDPITRDVRGTENVMTIHDNPAFITRVTSRSAPFTEVFFGDPDERQAGIMETAAEHLIGSDEELHIMDKQMGLHPEHSHHCRTIVTKDYARLLLMWDKLIFDLAPGREGEEPDQVLIIVPGWGEIAERLDLQPRCILVDAVNRVTFVLGSDYFGEVKKAHLRMAMYVEKTRYKQKQGGGLGVHAGGKIIRAMNASSGKLEDRGALFFGLSGTGKTTLSVHHFWLDGDKGETVIIRQDDFFVLSDTGAAFGTEDNAYIKTEGLEPEGQPLLYTGAISPHAVLENVYVDPKTRKPDFFRYDHPFVQGGQCMNGRGIVVRRELDYTDERVDIDCVDQIFFITRRETIVPPVVRLDTEQAAAFFMLGESILTSAADPMRAGESVREVGTNPFIVGPGGEEGNIFYEILKKNPHIRCFLLNTGGFGGRKIDRGLETLETPGALDKLRRYLDGEQHEDIGSLHELELQDGTKETFRTSFIRYEAFHNLKRLRSRNNLIAVAEGVERGLITGTDVELIEVGILAGRKIRIQDSAAIIREISRSRVQWKKDSYWGYEIPAEIPGLDISRFDTGRYYSPVEIKMMNEALKAERTAWLGKFPGLDPAIATALD